MGELISRAALVTQHAISRYAEYRPFAETSYTVVRMRKHETLFMAWWKNESEYLLWCSKIQVQLKSCK